MNVRLFRFVFGLALVASIGAISVSGCSQSGSVTKQEDENSAVESQSLSSVTITFPAIYFQDDDEDTAMQTLENLGGSNITHNDDGSYTVTLPRDKYDQLVSSMHDSVAGTFDSLPDDENYKSIQSVTYDDTFSNITITVDGEAYKSSFDSFSVYAVGIMANMYQQIAGQNVQSTIQVVDTDGNVLSTTVSPDDFENASSSTSQTVSAS